MGQASETRAPGAQPNIQDAFLNHARRERSTVSIQLLDGRAFDGRIRHFDRFALVVECEGIDTLVFKHAIATIESQRKAGGYFTPPQS
ncbi:MAG: RNA chaperone Hfq [Vicinamibacterales bacterium]